MENILVLEIFSFSMNYNRLISTRLIIFFFRVTYDNRTFRDSIPEYITRLL